MRDFKRIKFILMTMLCVMVSLLSHASETGDDGRFTGPMLGSQQSGVRKTVKGTVSDELGDPMPGVNVTVAGNASVGTTTNANGEFTLTVPSDTCSLIFSYIGYRPQTLKVGAREVFAVKMSEASEQLEEVTVVAFGTQKKESVSAAITTISPKNLKMPTSNLTTTFAGQMAGMISYQTSGEPGSEGVDFFIRGVTTFGYNVDPLILVDNIEISKSELTRIQPDDIESFSIMKDAAATALYGARGANGVILIKTNEGQVGKAKLNIRVENNVSMPTTEIKLADPITYMRMHNEAIITRTLTDPVLYSDEKIENTERGLFPMLYPATNWHDELLKDYTMNQRVNINVSGGGDVARYYVAASYSRDNGILKVDNKNNFNNNVDLGIYSLRSNVNVNLTKSTEMKVSLDGTFEDYTGPLNSGSYMYSLIMKSNPVLFPAYYPIDYEHRFITHTMFGNAGDGQYLNPYAQMVRGYRTYDKSTMGAQMEIVQKLDFLLEGLRLRALFNTKRIATSAISRSYSPYYYKLMDHNYLTGEYSVAIINPDASGESLSSSYAMPEIENTTYFESTLNYNKTLEDHDISAQLVYTMRNRTIPATANDANTVLGSLPYRNIGLAGRLTYSYQGKYFLEGNFGYNGSERFSEEHRWGFFPSISAGWIISNEKFFESLASTVTLLKLRASYGLAGNDNISDDRFLYLSNVSLTGSTGYYFGYDLSNRYSRPSITISRYADPDISWEVSYKSNVAMELKLWKDLEIVWEYFREDRTNILQDRTTIPYSMGLWANPQANLGKARGHGTEFSLTHNYANKSFWAQSRINFTYAVSEYTKYEDYDYETEYWKLRVGNSTTQQYGYIAEGLFIDDADVVNSPKQFGSNLVKAGDIKYRDVNGDGVISDLDMVPIGYPTTPEIQYGFGTSFGYKGWDFNFFFNGSHRRSFWIDYNLMSPFFNTTGSPEGHNNLAQFIADSYWSEANRDPYAVWPRLATSLAQVNHNNYRNTWFMRDGAFLRLKTLELGYNLPDNICSKLLMKGLRIYVTGNNIFTVSKFDLWDVEMAGNGLGYPIQRTYNAGIYLTF